MRPPPVDQKNGHAAGRPAEQEKRSISPITVHETILTEGINNHLLNN
jgi:hypothetical protein